MSKANRKLSPTQVVAIRLRDEKRAFYLRKAEEYSRKQSAEMYGVSYSTVRDIIDGTRYADITYEHEGELYADTNA